MPPAPLSHCCRAPIQHDGFGHVLCSQCWGATRPTTSPRDLVGWLFPAEQGPRPKAEPVFIRRGRKIALERPGEVRGRPDAWCWSDA